MPKPIHAEDDQHVSVRVSTKSRKIADKVVIAAMKNDLRVQGDVNPIRVRQSHVLKLALELGLPLVLDHLQEEQGKLKGAKG